MNDPSYQQGKWSESQLAGMRGRTIEEYKKNTGIEIKEFTCDKCPLKDGCVFVFDAYNTDGDCLAEK